ncbi:MAG: hypothetical protein L3J24_08380 [Xanthomonadales bacterium]|nr:hypothetical protein [Xanthomonadales bacterium]
MKIRFSFSIFIILMSISFLSVAASEQQGRIVTNIGKPVSEACLLEVEVDNIDGNNVVRPPYSFAIEPGSHTIKTRYAKKLVNRGNCLNSNVSRNINRYRIEPLELEVEAGKSYYIALDATDRDARNWKLVVWKVE